MKFFNKLFKQQPKQPEYQHIPWEVRASWYDQMHNQRKQEAVRGLLN